MTEIGTTSERRLRGRPQVRPDDETRQVIHEADRQRVAFGEEGQTFWYSCPVGSRLREYMTSIIPLIAEKA
jgi:hypothetical protein